MGVARRLAVVIWRSILISIHSFILIRASLTGLDPGIMADMQPGFVCEFVTKPPDAIQSECPVCLQVLRVPYQVTCCGYSFCRDCIQRVDNGKSPCPCCNTAKFEYFPNKGLQRSLYEFKVYCTNKSQGCQWTGELGQLTNHLNVDVHALQPEGGCQYVQIPCSYCCKPFNDWTSQSTRLITVA